MTTDRLDLDTGAPDLLEAAVEDADDGYRCGCAGCRALRGRPGGRDGRTGAGRDGEAGDG
jgi:hypothetical protein